MWACGNVDTCCTNPLNKAKKTSISMYILFIYVQIYIKTNLNINTNTIPKVVTCIIFDCTAAAVNKIESAQNIGNIEIIT